MLKRAVVTPRYGSPDLLQLCDVPRPSPAAGDVLIRVHAATVNRTDCGELRPRGLARLLFGFRPRRRIFGMDVAGVVEAVGPGVTVFKPGDAVFGMCPFRADGAHADYVRVPETAPIALMPPGTPFEQAVVCEGAYYADSGLKQFGVGPGHSILIYGASGAIGSSAVQLAKACGAQVTAVVAARHMQMARSLGADRVIDYAAEEFSHLGERFDFVFEAVGKTSYFRWRRLLKPGGVFMATDVGPGGQYLPLMIWSAIARDRGVALPLPARGSARAFVASLRDLMAADRFRAVIDRTYPMEQIADAYRYVETGQKAGIVVIRVAGPDQLEAGQVR